MSVVVILGRSGSVTGVCVSSESCMPDQAKLVEGEDVVLARSGVGDLEVFEKKVVNKESAEIYKHT